MSKSPRKFSSEFKMMVVLESYASGNALETADRHGIHITQLNKWRKQLKSKSEEVFKSRRGRNQHTGNTREEQLEKIIGKQAIQIELLKKTTELLN